jgi:hypothetical protein
MSKKASHYSTPFLDVSMMELAVPRLGGMGVMKLGSCTQAHSIKKQYVNINYNGLNNVKANI